MRNLDGIRFGLAGGILAGCLFFVLTLLSVATGYASNFLLIFNSVFVGYEISVFGSLIGAVYAFIFGFLKFFSVAFIYNMLAPQNGNNKNHNP